MIKFKVVLETVDNSSVASVALDASNAGGMPAEVVEFREKKKFLRTETRYFDSGNPFNAEIDENKLVKFLLELLYKANNLMNLVSLNPFKDFNPTG
jgi:hypothetical protein